MTTVRVRSSSPTVVIDSRKNATVVRPQPNSTTVRNGITPVTVGSQASTTTVQDRRPTIAIGSNIGPRGPQGARGLDGAGQVPPHAFSWGDAHQPIFTAAVDGVLTIVRIQMRTPFNGSGASIQIGTSGDPGAVMPAAWVDPYSALEFENSPDLAMEQGESVILTISAGTASAGAGDVFLTFVPRD